MDKLQERKISVGIDLHKTQFTVCAINEDYEVLVETQYKTTDKGYKAFIEKMKSLGHHIVLAVESTGNTRFFARVMEQEGFSVKVVNTSKFKVIVQSTSKTDKNDAKVLATYLLKEMIPESILSSDWDTEIKSLTKVRSILVSSCVKVKNQVHGILLGYGIVTTSACFQSKRARKRYLNDLKDQDVQLPIDSLKILFDIIDNLMDEINQIEEEMERYVREDKRIQLLMTIPGVGKILATTIASYTGDVNIKFNSYKQYCAYTGLVPWVKNSNETVHHGHITKRGPVELRTAFIQCAYGMIRQKSKYFMFRLLQAHEKNKIRIGNGKAIVAMARKIAKIAYFILSTEEPFNHAKMID